MIRAWNLLHTEIIRLPSIHPFQLAVSTLYLAPSSSSPHLPIRRTSDFNPLFKLHYFVQNLLFPILICTPSTTPMLAPEAEGAVSVFGGRSGGLMVRAPACRSRGRWFDYTSAVSKLGQFRSPHFAHVFRKRLKAVGQNSCVSSRLGCLEYNYLTLETKVKEILLRSR